MTDVKKALIVFVRRPDKGKVKTRLAASIGDESALRIYVQLLQHTRTVADTVPADKFIFYTDGIPGIDMWDGRDYYKCQQTGANLGARMQDAFVKLFDKGYEQVVIIGSDCPELSNDHINDAYDHLDKCDIVIGPAVDGGYYLLGMKKVYPALFAGKQWSTVAVFEDTMGTIRELALSVQQLPILNDVDEEKDVPVAWLMNKHAQ